MLRKLYLIYFLIRFGRTDVNPDDNQVYPQIRQVNRDTIVIGDCRIAVNRLCPDSEVTFYLYTRSQPNSPQSIRIGSDQNASNLTSSAFNPNLPTKIIVHGYNSDMHLSVLREIRKEYLKGRNYNVLAVDWSPLSMGPCYPAAVWNSRHVGRCTAQLVQRIRDTGATDIHVIGFSLGAHITNFMANHLAPYKVPRITGLDPALPGYATVSESNRLDKSDAQFVDVLHTNAFIQGQVRETGHVDFYINGGVAQPGCWAETRYFACNHHRAPIYFAESINSPVGFWGWPCPSYVTYLLGRCPPIDPQVIMGDRINTATRGVHLVITDSVAPFAVGKYTGPAIEIFLKSERDRLEILIKFKDRVRNYVNEDSLIDEMYGNSNNGFVDNIFDFSTNLRDDLDFIV